MRLILNLVPPNEIQIKISGDNQTLPYIGQWMNTNVQQGDPVYLNSEDMRACFNLFRLPPPWAVVFVIDEMMPGWVIDKPLTDWVYIGMITVPMGWVNAVGVLQYLHRQLLKKVNVLPRHLELRRDAPMPVDEVFNTASFVEIYVDNLDGFSVGGRKQRQSMKDLVLAVRTTGEVLGVVYDDGDKRIIDDHAIKTGSRRPRKDQISQASCKETRRSRRPYHLPAEPTSPKHKGGRDRRGCAGSRGSVQEAADVYP
jgi:hypothetical protein